MTMGIPLDRMEREMPAALLNEYIAEWNLQQREIEDANKKAAMKPRRR